MSFLLNFSLLYLCTHIHKPAYILAIYRSYPKIYETLMRKETKKKKKN